MYPQLPELSALPILKSHTFCGSLSVLYADKASIPQAGPAPPTGLRPPRSLSSTTLSDPAVSRRLQTRVRVWTPFAQSVGFLRLAALDVFVPFGPCQVSVLQPCLACFKGELSVGLLSLSLSSSSPPPGLQSDSRATVFVSLWPYRARAIPVEMCVLLPRYWCLVCLQLRYSSLTKRALLRTLRSYLPPLCLFNSDCSCSA